MGVSLASDIKEIMGLHVQCVQLEHKIEDLQEEKESMKEFYKEKIMALEAQISDLKKYNGISLRDHFAGLAMQGLLASDTKMIVMPGDIAEMAYNQAAFMLEYRDEYDA